MVRPPRLSTPANADTETKAFAHYLCFTLTQAGVTQPHTSVRVVDGAKLEAVCVYHPHLPTPYPLGTIMVPSYGPAGEGAREVYASPGGVDDAAADAHTTLERAAREAFGTDALPNLVLRAVDAHEHSAHEVLTMMAANADLLVVGARGHSGPLGLLLGSTAQSCTRHAKCPVLVVPATRPDDS